MELVQDSLGSYRLGRAFLDSCYQVNFMTEAFAQKLRLPRDKRSIQIRSIKSRLSPFELSLDLCAYQPVTRIDIST